MGAGARGLECGRGGLCKKDTTAGNHFLKNEKGRILNINTAIAIVRI